MNVDINLWAVLVCGVASMILGMLWYGLLFRKPWSKEMGFDKQTPEQQAVMKKRANASYPQAFIGALLMAYVLAHVLGTYEANTIALGLQGAFWAWLGFILPVKYGEKLWGGKSLKLVSIDTLYYLVQLAVFSIILVSWK